MTPTTDPTTLRDSVSDLIRAVAADEILSRFKNLSDSDVREKTRPGDLVTVADLAAEAALSEQLPALLTGSAVVGEEGAEADPDSLSVLATDRPVWVIDPVDGTRNFADGKPCFAVIVALCQGGETLAGWIYDPLGDQIHFAALGQGAFAGTGAEEAWQPLRAAQADAIEAMDGSLSRYAREKLAGRTPHPKRVARYGSVGREYMDLASGGLHFGLYGGRLKPWDHAAGVLIHAEAGGVSGLFPDRVAYGPAGVMDGHRLLLAPDPVSWKKIHKLIISS